MSSSLNAVEKQVCDHLAGRLDELYQLLEYHVSIPTGKDNVAGLDLYRLDLVERLKKLGAAIEIHDGQPRPDWMRQPGMPDNSQVPHPIVIARGPDSVSGPRILLAGHIDTVHDPDGEFNELVKQPDGVHAVGPGAVDMKGGITLALAALESLHENDIHLNWTFILNSDEETGSFQSETVLREVAAQNDYGIALEPALSDGSLAIERMGSGQFMIEVFGQSAHVGREFEKGISAVTRLGEVIVSLAEFAKPDEGMIVNVGPLKGGSVTNAVPDYAACWGNIRYANPEAGERLGMLIDGLVTSGEDLPRMVVHRHWNRPAKPLTPEVKTFAELARQAAVDLGQELPFAKTGGVCDGNILQDAGLPTIDTLGIRGGNLHRNDEFIEINSLVERAQLLALLMMRLGG